MYISACTPFVVALGRAGDARLQMVHEWPVMSMRYSEPTNPWKPVEPL